jgi:hypothetical protein
MSTSAESFTSYGSYGDPWAREMPAGRVIPELLPLISGSGVDGETSSPSVFVVGEDLYISFTELAFDEDPLAWRHQRTWCSARSGGRVSGELGPGWFLSDVPFLACQRQAEGKSETCLVVGGVVFNSSFIPDDEGGWRSESSEGHTLSHDTIDRAFRFSADGKCIIEFHDFDPSNPRQIRGRLKSIRNLATQTHARIEHQGNDMIKCIKWQATPSSRFRYSYQDASEADWPDRIGSVTQFHNETPVKRIAYQYFDKGRSLQHSGLLQGCASERWDGVSWIPEQRTLFRYTRGLVQLGEIKIWQVPSITSDADANSRTLSVARYEIRYTPSGKVLWIRHEGDGAPPQFFD